ncbi:PepSY domain-containing protein [Zoogloea sp. 1C4]|uniref:PepSY domain-containing protein n=1 Tax=Zoogloea sp. 1C4 TaxID=2570190 RepID=UPI0012922716|nr:PepSY domain-containing protein [Zoogloea sp. 1C4]
MRATTLIATLALTSGLIGAGATLTPAFAQSTAPAITSAAPATATSNWMSIKDVLNKLEAVGYRDFREVDRDDNLYEVKAVDPQGQRVELDVDPITGQVLRVEVKRTK